MHIDVDAIRDSKIVQKAFQTCPMLKDSGKHFDEIRDKIGVDLRKDLHGVTLYGSDTDKTHGVAIVFSTVDRELLLKKAESAADHKVTRHGDIKIHSWTGKHDGKTHPAAGAFFKPDVLVFAADADRVAAAIDVFKGESAGLSGNSPLGGKPPAGSTFIARAIAFPEAPHAPRLKLVKSLRIATGEHDGTSFYRANFVMKTSDAATQVKAISDGFMAMGTLRFGGDADVEKLIDGLKTSVDSKTVKVRWEASADDVWTVIEKVAKKAEEHFRRAPARASRPLIRATALE